jgi:hypothetical protein
MSRTQGRISADLGQPDGQIFVSPLDIAVVSGTATVTRNAAGDFSLNIGNSQTCVLAVSLSTLIFRYGLNDWLQENFGSAQAMGSNGQVVNGFTAVVTANASAGNNVNVAVGNSANFIVGFAVTAGTQKTFITAIPDATHITLATLTATLTAGSFISQGLYTTPAGVTGPPPFTGVTQFTPVTAPRPKGIRVREMYPWYLVAGLALTTNTIGLTQTVAANATALAVTNIVANAANGLATATQATPYLTPVMLATPAYLTTKYASYNIEWDVTTGASGTARIYGIYLDLELNYN